MTPWCTGRQCSLPGWHCDPSDHIFKTGHTTIPAEYADKGNCTLFIVATGTIADYAAILGTLKLRTAIFTRMQLTFSYVLWTSAGVPNMFFDFAKRSVLSHHSLDVPRNASEVYSFCRALGISWKMATCESRSRSEFIAALNVTVPLFAIRNSSGAFSLWRRNFHKPLYYQDWAPGKPSSRLGNWCLEASAKDGGKWNDVDCSKTFTDALCECSEWPFAATVSWMMPYNQELEHTIDAPLFDPPPATSDNVIYGCNGACPIHSVSRQ